MKAKAIVSIERVRELLRYDSETGALFWRVRPRYNSPAKAGDVAGTVKKVGYRVVGIDGCQLKAHRLAWVLHYGEWPMAHLDHINRAKDDNRIANLRQCVDGIENNHNRSMSRNNTSGFPGVSWTRQRNRWRAGIRSDGKSITIGYYATADEASKAYQEAKRRLHGPNRGSQ